MLRLDAATASAPFPDFLPRFCRQVAFNAGDILRHEGERYSDIYLVADGILEAHARRDSGARPLLLRPGAIFGEIGSLHGSRAEATVVAKTDGRALVIEDGTIWKIEAADPKLAVEFCRYLAKKVAVPNDERPTLASLLPGSGKTSNIDVFLCRDEALLLDVMKLRYHVCCNEYGRDSPDADHVNKLLRDRFDEFGHVFAAVENGELIGTLRTNLAREGSLGMFEDLYGMSASKNHPERTAICGKFTVKKSKRGSPAFLQLCTEWLRFAMSKNVVECYIGCEPPLTSTYAMLGFRQAAERFYHYDFGPNDPMVLDLTLHGKRLCGLAGLRP